MFLRVRYSNDRRYRERLAGSYLASVLAHALLATLLFAIVANSSQEGATESQAGGQLVTLEARAPAIAQVPVPVRVAAPIPRAPRIARVAHPRPVVAAAQPLPPRPRELAVIKPNGTPQPPTPAPQATAVPSAQPTTPTIEPSPSIELPAVPVPVPTVPAVTIALKIPPTAAPRAAPSVIPSARPTPRPPLPTAKPSAKPVPAATTAPSAAPTAVAVQARATAAASATPAAVSRATAPPSAKSGVPSPSPTQGAAVAVTKGIAPSPGPKGLGSPGPRAGENGTKPGQTRPVAVRPTASPEPTPASSAGGKSPATDLNARLRALLPNNPVNPTQYSYHPPASLGGGMDPTPPPAVLAATHFIFTQRGDGGDAALKMWVTSVRRVGPALVCDGWLVRYPRNPNSLAPAGNGAQVTLGGGLRGGTLPPIVEGSASVSCDRRGMVPFVPSPVPSP